MCNLATASTIQSSPAMTTVPESKDRLDSKLLRHCISAGCRSWSFYQVHLASIGPNLPVQTGLRLKEPQSRLPRPLCITIEDAGPLPGGSLPTPRVTVFGTVTRNRSVSKAL
ncbi:hypothetical protein CGRA01v4_03008 [Colletotrichum graminicola]|nr:hypothetical protein CGRA01v4_03008 [Colletotrichum graminicola]